MKHRLRNCSVLCIFIVVIFTVGCGGVGKDSPGVTVSATITPTYNGSNSSSVDVVQQLCTNSSGTSVQTQPEFFADHMATVLLNAGLINPSNIVKQMTIYLDSYTISYASSADSPGAPPMQSDTRAKTLSFIVTGETTTTSFSVEFVDLIRKNQYFSDVTGGTFIGPVPLNNYTATYTFQGHAQNGVPITFYAQTDFQIGSFNNCPAGFF